MDYEKEILNLNKKLDMLISLLNPVQEKSFSLFEWFDYWLNNFKKDNIKKSWFSDKVRYIEYIKKNISDCPLEKINIEETNQYLVKLKKTNSKEKLIITLKDCLRTAFKYHYLKEDYSTLIFSYKHLSEKGKALTVDERYLFLKNVVKFKHGDALLFIFFTGCRLHGCLKLKWEDIDFKNKILHLPETKTLKSNRYIRMIKQVEQILLNQNKENEFVFNVSKKTLERLARKISSVCKFDFKIKDLRTTYGTFCAEQSLSDIFTQNTMGHSNISTTKKYYQTLLSDFELEQSQKLEDAFSQMCQNWQQKNT